MVEHLLAKEKVASSNLVFRSTIWLIMLEETITKFLKRANTKELKYVDLRDEFADLDSLINDLYIESATT